MIVSRLLQLLEHEWPPRTQEASIKAVTVDFDAFYMVCIVKPLVSLNYKNAIISIVCFYLPDLPNCTIEYIEYSDCQNRISTLLSLWYSQNYSYSPFLRTFIKIYFIYHLEFWLTIIFFYLPRSQKKYKVNFEEDIFLIKIDKKKIDKKISWPSLVNL